MAGRSLRPGGGSLHLLVLRGPGRPERGRGEPAAGGGPGLRLVGHEAEGVPWHGADERERPAGPARWPRRLLHGPA